MAFLLSPIFNCQQFFDGNGDPLAGGQIGTFLAGSFTNGATTYSDNTGTENTNPINLDSSGRITVNIWLDSETLYNLVLYEADGTTPITNCDQIYGIPTP